MSIDELVEDRVEVPGLWGRDLSTDPPALGGRLRLTSWSHGGVAGRYRELSMASDGDKVSVALDATIVADVRRVVDPAVKGDAAAVERALNAYLLGRLVDQTQARSDPGAEDAEHVAYDEVHAQRREDRGAMMDDPTDAPAAVSASELVRVMRERNAPRRAAVLRHVAALRRRAERLRNTAE